MLNVIPFLVRAGINPALDAASTARTTASVVAELMSMVEEIRGLSERVLPLPYDAREVERTLQALLDAISAIEHATEVLTQHGERTPFGAQIDRGVGPTSEAKTVAYACGALIGDSCAGIRWP
jgi:hypothetical protein